MKHFFRKCSIVFLILLLPFSSIYGFEAPKKVEASGFAGGIGSSSNPYQIATAEQLDNIRNVNTLHKHFILTADIDLSGYTNWDPLPTFEGVFDGNGYEIQNLTIKKNVNSVGLFKEISRSSPFQTNGFIKNVTIVNADVTGGADTGILVGKINGNSSLYPVIIENSYIQGTVQNYTNVRYGGLTGSSEYVEFKDITLDINIDLKSNLDKTFYNVGGLTGLVSYGKFNRTQIKGNVSVTGNGLTKFAPYNIGGLVGTSTNGNYDDITLEVDLNISSSNADVYKIGGMIGNSSYGTYKNITTLPSTIKIRASESAYEIGGIVGFSTNRQISLTKQNIANHADISVQYRNSYNLKEVYRDIGGLFGSSLNDGGGQYLTNHGNITIKNSGNIARNIGGIYGKLDDNRGDDHDYLSNHGEIHSDSELGESYQIGGIAGYARAQTMNTYWHNLENTGTIFADGYSANPSFDEYSYYAGGLFGYFYSGATLQGRIHNGINKGTVQTNYATDEDYFPAGIIGFSRYTDVKNNYNLGLLENRYNQGGNLQHYTSPIASRNNNSNYSNNYYLDNTSSGLYNTYFTDSITESQAKQSTTYSNFNFDGPWDIQENTSFPWLAYTAAGSVKITTPIDFDIIETGTVNIDFEDYFNKNTGSYEIRVLEKQPDSIWQELDTFTSTTNSYELYIPHQTPKKTKFKVMIRTINKYTNQNGSWSYPIQFEFDGDTTPPDPNLPLPEIMFFSTYQGEEIATPEREIVPKNSILKMHFSAINYETVEYEGYLTDSANQNTYGSYTELNIRGSFTSDAEEKFIGVNLQDDTFQKGDMLVFIFRAISSNGVYVEDDIRVLIGDTSSSLSELSDEHVPSDILVTN